MVSTLWECVALMLAGCQSPGESRIRFTYLLGSIPVIRMCMGCVSLGIRRCIPVEEMLLIYLSPGEVSSLNALVLPSKLCQATSRLVGKAYATAGQAGGALNTMAVLQAC